jgi:hypothetical protein
MKGKKCSQSYFRNILSENNILRTYKKAEGATKKTNDFVIINRSGKFLKTVADK